MPPKKANALKDSPKGARMRTHLRVMLNDEIAMGPGKADLLEAIRDTGSISAAGKQLGMSYRRAWLLVDTMNRCFKSPLVETAAGGVAGGGARLSAAGDEMLQRYRALEAAVTRITEKGFADLKPLLRRTPATPAADK
jgi:molybdate transport system regulatory protein